MPNPIAPQQARSQASLERILDAVERLLEMRPFTDITVGDIAHEAGVSAGLLYSRFRSKEDILPFLMQRFLKEQKASFEAAFDRPDGASDLPERVARVVGQVRGMSSQSLGLLRAAAARRILRPDALPDDERELMGDIRQVTMRYLERGAEEVRRGETQRALEFVNWMVFLTGQLAPMVIADEEDLQDTMEDLTTALILFLTTSGSQAVDHIGTGP